MLWTTTERHTLSTISDLGVALGPCREIDELALQEVLGQPLRELADMTGRIEQAILAETLARHDVSNPEGKFDECIGGHHRP